MNESVIICGLRVGSKGQLPDGIQKEIILKDVSHF